MSNSDDIRAHSPKVISTPVEMFSPYAPENFHSLVRFEMQEQSDSFYQPSRNMLIAVHAERPLLNIIERIKRMAWNRFAPKQYHYADSTTEMEHCLRSCYSSSYKSAVEDSDEALPIALLYTRENTAARAAPSFSVIENFGLVNCSGAPLTVFLPTIDRRIALTSATMSGAAFGELCVQTNISAVGGVPWIIVFGPSTGGIHEDLAYFYDLGGEEVNSQPGLFEKLIRIARAREIDDSFQLAGLFVKS